MPELGAWLQEQTFILVALGKALMLISGWGIGEEDNREPHFTGLCSYDAPAAKTRPFPFLFFLINFS